MLNIERTHRSDENIFLYIIGNNGSGKSTFLRDCAIKHKDEFKKIIGIPCGMHDRFEPKSSGNFYYLGYRSKNNSIFLTTLRKNITLLILGLLRNNKRDQLNYIFSTINIEMRFFKEATMWDKRSPLSRRASEDQRNAVDTIIDNYNTNGLSAISASDALLLEECIQLDLRYFAKFRIIQKSAKNAAPLKDEFIVVEDLSSGYVQKLRLLLSIAKEVESDSLVLIDEPEISLHVTWQADIPNLFRSAFAGLKRCVLIVATHSPVIISNVTQEIDYVYTVPDGETIESQKIPSDIEKLLFQEFKYLPLSSKIIPETCTKVLHLLIHGTINQEQALDKIKTFRQNKLSDSDRDFLDRAIEIINNFEEDHD